MLEAFLRQRLPQEAASEFGRHLNQCPQCQAAAEARLSPPAWAGELLWFPDQPERVTTPSQQPDDTDPGDYQVTRSQPVAANTAYGSVGQRTLGGRFELRRTIGMGGCGTVFAAWDTFLQREVALKVPHWSLCEKPSVRQRFGVEARAAARLNHPNIVPVYEARIEDGVESYLVSELVRGPSLEAWQTARRAEGTPIAIRQAVEIVAELAAGVEFAHRAGVLHRDLKPSNVLLAPTPAGSLPFTPRITDFGLARLSEEATQSTVDGGVCGSLQYMAPEQALSGGRVGPACDVYSLGVILYELVTGKLPISADSPLALLAAIPVQPVESARRWRSDVPADLDAICLKCLEKRPASRYASAESLERDLRRFLAGEAVTARLPTRFEQGARWIRRHPTRSAIAATIVVSALTVLGVLVEANQRQSGLIRELGEVNSRLTNSNVRLEAAVETAGELRLRSERLRRQSDAERRQAQDNLYVSEFRRAWMAWQEDDLPGLARILARLEQPEFRPFRGVECDWLQSKLDRQHRTVTQFPAAPYCMVFSADRSFFVAAGSDSVVRIVRTSDGRTMSEWSSWQREINGLFLTPDERTLWTTGDDGSLCKWDVGERKELLRIAAHAPEQAHDLFAVPERNLLITTGSDGRVCQWDWISGESRGVLQDSESGIRVAAMTPDGKAFACAADGRIRVHDLTAGTVTVEWNVPANQKAMLISQDGAWVLFSLANQTIEVRSAATGMSAGKATVANTIVRFVPLPDRRRVYAIDDHGGLFEVELPDPNSSPSVSNRLHMPERSLCRLVEQRIFCACLSPDRQELWTGQADGRLLAWPLADLVRQAFVTSELPGTRQVAFTSEGKTLVVASGDLLRELDATNLNTIRQLEAAPNSLTTIAVLPDGDLLTGERTPSRNSRLTRRRSRDWTVHSEISLGPLEREFGGLYVDPRLNLVMASARSYQLDFATIAPLEPMRPFVRQSPRDSAALDPVLSRFACSEGDGLAVVDTLTREVLWTISKPGSALASMAFSPDGRWLVTCGYDRMLCVREAATGRRLAELSGHRGLPQYFAVTRDGRTLFSADDQGEIKVWHLPAGELLCEMDVKVDIRGRESPGQLLLAPDESRLLLLENERALKIIPLKSPVR